MSFNWGAPSTGVGIFAYDPIIIHKKRIKSSGEAVSPWSTPTSNRDESVSCDV